MADWIAVGAKDDRDSAKQICSVCLGGAVLWRRGFVHRDNLEAFGERGVEALVGPIRGVVNNLDVIDSVRKGDIVNAIRYSAGADRFIRSPWREERDHLTEAVTLWFEQNRTAATDLQLTAALLTASAEAEARRTFDDPEAAGTAPPAGPGGQAGGRTGGFADPLPRLAADRLRGLTGPLNDPAANTFYDPNDERMERGGPAGQSRHRFLPQVGDPGVRRNRNVAGFNAAGIRRRNLEQLKPPGRRREPETRDQPGGPGRASTAAGRRKAATRGAPRRKTPYPHAGGRGG